MSRSHRRVHAALLAMDYAHRTEDARWQREARSAYASLASRTLRGAL